jgi:hypothetical protein
MNIRFASRLLLILFLTSKCSTYEPRKHLDENQYNDYLLKVSPFVNKKPKNTDFDDRFHKSNQHYYQILIAETNARLDFFYPTDTAIFFLYTLKDLTSLYEHYRAHGGYFRVNAKDSIVHLNLLFYTPRFTGDEMKEKGTKLFKEMVKKVNLKKYMGNRDYIHVPNDDFEYSAVENRWVYTENSSWKFLEEAKESAGSERREPVE